MLWQVPQATVSFYHQVDNFCPKQEPNTIFFLYWDCLKNLREIKALKNLSENFSSNRNNLHLNWSHQFQGSSLIFSVEFMGILHQTWLLWVLSIKVYMILDKLTLFGPFNSIIIAGKPKWLAKFNSVCKQFSAFLRILAWQLSRDKCLEVWATIKDVHSELDSNKSDLVKA